MGKNKKNKMNVLDLKMDGKSLIGLHTQSLNKHGELKGKNKQETRALTETCMHHIESKKGKLKSRVDVNQEDKMAHCTMCNHDFQASLYDKESAKDVIDAYKGFVDHTKYIAAAVGVDEKTQRILASMNIQAVNAYKLNRKLTKIVSKEDRVKSKKKKNRGNVSSEFGAWAIRSR